MKQNVLHKFGYNIYIGQAGLGHDLMELLLPNPDDVLDKGENLQSEWKSDNSEKGFFVFNDKQFFYKKYLAKNVVYYVKNFFRKSRAYKSFYYAQIFKTKGLPTIQPLILLEKRFCGFLGISYLIFPKLPDSENLLKIWHELGESQKRECLECLGKVIGKMHHHRILHGDLNWRNILVSQGKKLNGFIVDLDGCKIHNVFNEQMFLNDLDHFLRDVRRADVSKQLWDGFFRNWAKELGGSVPKNPFS